MEGFGRKKIDYNERVNDKGVWPYHELWDHDLKCARIFSELPEKGRNTAMASFKWNRDQIYKEFLVLLSELSICLMKSFK